METKNKGLADQQEGNIILNESGTSINTEQNALSTSSELTRDLPENEKIDNKKNSSAGPEEKDISA